jgi:hypothetical protein
MERLLWLAAILFAAAVGGLSGRALAAGALRRERLAADLVHDLEKADGPWLVMPVSVS